MNKNKILLGFFLMALSASTAFSGDLLDGGSKLPSKEETEGAHRNLTGTVEKIESDLVFLKTSEGTTRTFSVKEVAREGVKSLKPGDQVTLEFDEANAIIDIHKDKAIAKGSEESVPGDKGGVSGDASKGHKSVVGTLETYDATQKIVILKTDQGKSETFQVKDAAATKLNGVKKGEKITLEIDEQNRVMDAHG
jgi:Cu/Ag efflux protein CusF